MKSACPAAKLTEESSEKGVSVNFEYRLGQHALNQAMDATVSLWAYSDTKWPIFMITRAQEMIMESALALALHLRRFSEITGVRINRSIEPLMMGIPGRNVSSHETSLWSAINSFVHHKTIKPHIIVDDKYFRTATGEKPGYLLIDVELTTDRRRSLVNIGGYVVAAMNEINELPESLSGPKVEWMQ